MLYIRTDANKIIATGHVMRCLTVANEVKRLGCDVTFVVSDEGSELLIRDNNYPVLNMNSDWKNPCERHEWDQLSEKIEDNDVMLIDSYQISDEYYTEMRKHFKLACFDDMFERKYNADIIINYNMYHYLFDYSKRYTTEKLLIGTSYTPIREQFKEYYSSSRIINKGRKKVLLICGGGDYLNSMYRILEYIIRMDNTLFSSLDWRVVVGRYNPNKDKLLKLQNEYQNIKVYSNVSNMALLMQGCDICISAASTVLYECCIMKLPTVFYCVADNQKFESEGFALDNMMLYAGDYLSNAIETLEMIIKNLNMIVNDDVLYCNMIEKMGKIIDCDGAKRIAKVLVY